MFTTATTITSAAVYTLLQGFCFNVLLPVWALAISVLDAVAPFLGI